MPFPRALARFNKRFTNRFVEPLVARTSTFVIIEHVGRRSGRVYRTPINLFECDDGFVAALTYGPSADWVQNVLAGSAVCERLGVRYGVEGARITGRDEVWSCLPRFVRFALRSLRVHHFCRVSLVEEITSQ